MTTEAQADTPFLSHKEYAHACLRAANEGKRLVTHVQVQIQGATMCAVIKDAWTAPNLRDMWKVEVIGNEAFKGLHNLPVHKVRRCSGVDGHCMCAGEVQ